MIGIWEPGENNLMWYNLPDSIKLILLSINVLNYFIFCIFFNMGTWDFLKNRIQNFWIKSLTIEFQIFLWLLGKYRYKFQTKLLSHSLSNSQREYLKNICKFLVELSKFEDFKLKIKVGFSRTYDQFQN